MSRWYDNRRSWLVVVVLTLGAAIFAAAPYFLLDPSYSRVKIVADHPFHFPLLLIHIFFSFVALLMGWTQFLPSLRIRNPKAHRVIGRIYLGCVAIGAVTGIIVGFYTTSYIRQIAFLTLSVLWLITGWRGFQSARQRRFEEHRVWMARNYAITLVASTARLVTPICILIFRAGGRNTGGGGVDFVLEHVLEVNIWLGLVINMVVAEWLIVRPSKEK
ncbi:DUF2306 domain-containing protein [Cohnella cholangitidis]|uniref:DUF2306 domain-containing protein n=1 Tax=Cohnella cholangitidis TaxID=2598458 RepID=A0A7G5C352_9BACL|nr:DUF2306 domain-containing protein [Cohnella cholangitidis]QMV43636.1 DUF2306 domain-containing protein [Cohnella cholangitidis]